MPAPATLTKTEYAKLRGCTGPYIWKLIKRGQLYPPAVRSDGMIDVAAADAMLGPAVPALKPLVAEKPVVTPEPTELDPSSYAANRARREAANARIAELELDELNGELVRRDVVEREIADQIGGLREAIMMVPREIAGQCALLGDERKIEAAITAALKRVLMGKAAPVADERRDAA